MKYLLFILFLLVMTSLNAQVYSCIFSDSIGVVDEYARIDTIRQKLSEKGLPNEVIDQYMDRMFSGTNPFVINGKRYTKCMKDSTLIVLDYSSTGPIKVNMGNKNFMIKDGLLFRLKNDIYIKSEINDSSSLFIASNEKKIIKNYVCEEYISLDGKYKIWTSNELPSYINPGVETKGINQAILGFEIIINKSRTTSILSEIHEMKEVI